MIINTVFSNIKLFLDNLIYNFNIKTINIKKR